MSQKKKRRRAAAPGRKAGNDLPERSAGGRRMDPRARNLLLVDLVFLSAAQLLSRGGYLSETAASLATAAGFVMLVLSIYWQFKPKDKGPKLPKS